MAVKLNVLGLLLAQEVGFDIVTPWTVQSPIVKGVVGIFALGLVGVILFKLFSRSRKSPR